MVRGGKVKVRIAFQNAQHDKEQLDTGRFQLTSILLSRDPALLRRPRLPAQDMQTD